VDNLKKNFAQNNNLFSKRSSNLTELFFSQTSRLKRIIAGLGLRAADAEDVLQDLYIKVVNEPFEYENADKAVQWLMKVTVNLCLAEHRRIKRFNAKQAEITSEKRTNYSIETDAIIINEEECEIIREAMRQMDDDFLTVLVLRYFCDFDSQQISEILSMNPSTVRSRLRTARITLAKKLIEKGIEP
jgi:RNA polymerase sigma factor (sigma-70 family)